MNGTTIQETWYILDNLEKLKKDIILII